MAEEKKLSPMEAQYADLHRFHAQSENFKEVLRQKRIRAHVRHRDPGKGILNTVYYVRNEDGETYRSYILSTKGDEGLCPSLCHNKDEVPRGGSGSVKSAFSFDTQTDLRIILSGNPSPFVGKRVNNKANPAPGNNRSPVDEDSIINEATIDQDINGHPVTTIAYKNERGIEKCIQFQRRCSGQEAASYINEARNLTEGELAEFMHACLMALRDFHNKDYVHLDIKPQNIMYDKKTRVAKLIDFGCSFHTERDKNKDRKPGTPGFMSPEHSGEQGAGPIGKKSDIYSMGITMQTLFAGRRMDPAVSQLILDMRSQDRPTADQALKKLEKIVRTKNRRLANKLARKSNPFQEQAKEVAASTLIFVGIISFWVAEFLAPALGGTALSTLIGGATLFGGITVGALLSYVVFPVIVLFIGIATMYTQFSPQPAAENQKLDVPPTPLSIPILHRHESLDPLQVAQSYGMDPLRQNGQNDSQNLVAASPYHQSPYSPLNFNFNFNQSGTAAAAQQPTSMAVKI